MDGQLQAGLARGVLVTEAGPPSSWETIDRCTQAGPILPRCACVCVCVCVCVLWIMPDSSYSSTSCDTATTTLAIAFALSGRAM